jgi:hypothetical protein
MGLKVQILITQTWIKKNWFFGPKIGPRNQPLTNVKTKIRVVTTITWVHDQLSRWTTKCHSQDERCFLQVESYGIKNQDLKWMQKNEIMFLTWNASMWKWKGGTPRSPKSNSHLLKSEISRCWKSLGQVIGRRWPNLIWTKPSLNHCKGCTKYLPKWGHIFKTKTCNTSYGHLKGHESNYQNHSKSSNCPI